MPLYTYLNTKTNKVVEVLRPMSESSEDYIDEDGEICQRIFYDTTPADPKKGFRATRAGQKLEVFQSDPSFVRKMNPRYVTFLDKHREKYDPNKHC